MLQKYDIFWQKDTVNQVTLKNYVEAMKVFFIDNMGCSLISENLSASAPWAYVRDAEGYVYEFYGRSMSSLDMILHFTLASDPPTSHQSGLYNTAFTLNANNITQIAVLKGTHGDSWILSFSNNSFFGRLKITGINPRYDKTRARIISTKVYDICDTVNGSVDMTPLINSRIHSSIDPLNPDIAFPVTVSGAPYILDLCYVNHTMSGITNAVIDI